jgi:hypothetical protein
MPRPTRLHQRVERSVIAVLACLAFAATAAAEDAGSDFTPNWYLQGGAYTHFKNKPTYVGQHWFVGVEREYKPNTVVGLSVFDNSFGQFSQYLYYGKIWHPWQKHPGFRVKLTGGLVHGYAGEHKDTSPINWGDAWAIGVVPGVGYQQGKLGFDLAFLSASGLLFLVGYSFE